MTTLTETQSKNQAVPAVAAQESSHAPALTNQAMEKVALALACAKVGIGLGQMLAPQLISKWMGRPHRPVRTRVSGFRHFTAGMGILKDLQAGSTQLPVGAMMSLAGMVGGTLVRRTVRRNAAVVLAVTAGAAAAGIVIARQFAARSPKERTLRFSASTTINLPPRECYRYWHDVERFPEFFDHLKSVRVTGDRQSHWIAKAPAGQEVSWDSEITEDMPDQSIAWQALNAKPCPMSGSVRFEPVRGGAGTLVRLRMAYEMPSPVGRGAIGAVLGHDPGFRLRKTLRRFKSLLEAGEIATTEGQSSGRAAGATQLDRLVRI